MAAFEAAVEGVSLSAEAAESICARCLELLRSSDPDYRKLIFLITQSFYFAQLADIGLGPFGSLTQESFAGSVFYVDTNVLIQATLGAPLSTAFHELHGVANPIHDAAERQRFLSSSREDWSGLATAATQPMKLYGCGYGSTNPARASA